MNVDAFFFKDMFSSSVLLWYDALLQSHDPCRRDKLLLGNRKTCGDIEFLWTQMIN